MTKSLDQYRSPNHKVLALLHTGRDKLREKYSDLREKYRTAQNQNRVVEASRAEWRRRAEQAERELDLLKKAQQEV